MDSVAEPASVLFEQHLQWSLVYLIFDRKVFTSILKKYESFFKAINNVYLEFQHFKEISFLKNCLLKRWALNLIYTIQ